MLKEEHTFHYLHPFKLESGAYLQGFQLKYTTLGKLNQNGSNVVWICHALTGSSDVTTWWPQFFSNDTPFSTREYFIICANTLGGCYGSTGPLSINPETGKPYYHTFPHITNRDVVNAFDLLSQELKIQHIHTLIGGSLGGQQVLEWAITQPSVFQNIISIACNAYHSPWGIAFNEAQRMAITADATWKENHEQAGSEGMKAARAIAMISFRNYDTFNTTQEENDIHITDNYKAASYQRYQGEKLAGRFNAYTYWTLTKMMDSHHVGRNRESTHIALQQIQANALIIGIDSDILFPVNEQQLLAEAIPNAQLKIISSLYGHDGFLVELEQLKTTLHHFLRTEKVRQQ
jgi:homoserine O-acetyltransferase/O-succinyltransferase